MYTCPAGLLTYRGADTTKQALGMLEIHFLNLGLAAIVVEKECIT